MARSMRSGPAREVVLVPRAVTPARICADPDLRVGRELTGFQAEANRHSLAVAQIPHANHDQELLDAISDR